MTSDYHKRSAAIKARYPRAYHLWSQEDENLLLEMYIARKTVEEMSIALQRQPSAIKSRIKKQKFIASPDSHVQTEESTLEKPGKSAVPNNTPSNPHPHTSHFIIHYSLFIILPPHIWAKQKTPIPSLPRQSSIKHQATTHF